MRRCLAPHEGVHQLDPQGGPRVWRPGLCRYQGDRGSWRVTCNGRRYSGNTWYRITNISGKSATSRYGVSSVYAATALFKSVSSFPKWTACDNVALRTRPSTSSTRKALLPDGVKVAAVARVSGSPWRVTCNGVTKSGSSWFRISHVNGKNSAMLYGVPYVYAASALFTSTAPASSSTTPTPTPAPTPNPSTGTSVRVTSIPALLTALDDNSVTDIVVANGTYRISTAASQRSDSLWIGSRFSDRTNPVTVRAETSGGVIFDGGGASMFGGITFVDGAHHQTWDGFVWLNGTPAGTVQGTGTGIVVFGGYQGKVAPHHITLRNCTLKPNRGAYTGGHGVYFSWAASPGPHDILIDGLTVDDPDGFMTSGAGHFYHSDASNPNAYNVTIRNARVTGTRQGFLIWDQTVHDLVIEDSTITSAKETGVSYEYGRAITLRRVTSTGSGVAGFYSSKGSNPAEVTFIDVSLN